MNGGESALGAAHCSQVPLNIVQNHKHPYPAARHHARDPDSGERVEGCLTLGTLLFFKTETRTPAQKCFSPLVILVIMSSCHRYLAEVRKLFHDPFKALPRLGRGCGFNSHSWPNFSPALFPFPFSLCLMQKFRSCSSLFVSHITHGCTCQKPPFSVYYSRCSLFPWRG